MNFETPYKFASSSSVSYGDKSKFVFYIIGFDLILLLRARRFSSLAQRACQLLLIATSLLASSAHAQGTSPVPTKLFGISLGSTFKINHDQDVDVSKVPAKAIRGVESSFSAGGIHMYIEPVAVNENFPYEENKKSSHDKHFKTTYRLYAIPIIPSKISTTDELNKSLLEWEIVGINWEKYGTEKLTLDRDSDEAKAIRRSDYYWAVSMCKTFETAFIVKPKITDINISASDTYVYRCEFVQGDRSFEVDGTYGKKVSLTLVKDVLEKKSNEIDTRIRQLLAKDLLR